MVIHSQINPIAFAIGPVTVHWYGVAFAGTFVFGEWLVRRMLLQEGRSDIDTSKLVIYAMVGAIFGARIAHCVFYDPQYYLTNPWKVFAVWEGGLASHGGVIGLVLGLIISTSKLEPGTLAFLLDRITIPASIGGAIVRCANFANSEILGLPTEGPFGVIFDAVDQVPRHPVQLYEAVAYLALGGLLHYLYARTAARWKPGRLTGVFLLGVFSARMLLEGFKVPQAAYETGMLLSVGQMLSFPFLGIGLLLVLGKPSALPNVGVTGQPRSIPAKPLQ
jgi:phosphatidylglycerol---prolipoprotein diacylglyceryl transferase